MDDTLQSRQQMLDGYLREIRLRMQRDSVAIVKADARGQQSFVDPFDFYTEPTP